jgi:hypothetical protein
MATKRQAGHEFVRVPLVVDAPPPMTQKRARMDEGEEDHADEQIRRTGGIMQ